jgi:hypothetical protein
MIGLADYQGFLFLFFIFFFNHCPIFLMISDFFIGNLKKSFIPRKDEWKTIDDVDMFDGDTVLVKEISEFVASEGDPVTIQFQV